MVLLALGLDHTACNPSASSSAWWAQLPNPSRLPGALGCFIQCCSWVKFPMLKHCKGQTEECKWERSPFAHLGGFLVYQGSWHCQGEAVPCLQGGAEGVLVW